MGRSEILANRVLSSRTESILVRREEGGRKGGGRKGGREVGKEEGGREGGMREGKVTQTL